MAAGKNFELACLQLQHNRAGYPRFLARSLPKLFCQASDHGLSLCQEYIAFKSILDRDRLRGAVRHDFVFVDAPRQFMQAQAIAPEGAFECASIPSGWMTKSPSGLRQSEASFARNLLGATPAEAVRFSSWRICSRIVRATSVAVGRPVLFWVTSR